jgi:multifunctional beta-oxidation protein
MSTCVDYENQVAVITEVGNGPGRAYAMFFAVRGAKLVVGHSDSIYGGHDPLTTDTSNAADLMVREIASAGGIAVAVYNHVYDGEKIIETAINKFGRVDVLLNNAELHRDRTLLEMKTEDWDAVLDLNVHGTMRTLKAAWAHMRRQKYGRIVNISSTSGLFGAPGQSNYVTTKMAMIGLSNTLAKEGAKYNIRCNVVASETTPRHPHTVGAPENMEDTAIHWAVSLVGLLVSKGCHDESGAIFEASVGRLRKIRWERSKGLFTRPEEASADLLLQNFPTIIDWEDADHPDTGADPLALFDLCMSAPKANIQPTARSSFNSMVVLVTGAGDGLGRAYALEFGRLGARVVVMILRTRRKSQMKSM